MRPEAEIMDTAANRSPFSNGTEGYAWMDNWCERCVNNNEATELWCPILSAALLGKTPTEWTEKPWRQIKGRPEGEVAPTLGDTYHCSEFEERHEGNDDSPQPEPEPECDGQLDIVDVYLDTAISELTKVPEVAR